MAVSDEQARLIRSNGEPILGPDTAALAADLLDERALSEERRQQLEWRQWDGGDSTFCTACGGIYQAGHQPTRDGTPCPIPRLIAKALGVKPEELD